MDLFTQYMQVPFGFSLIAILALLLLLLLFGTIRVLHLPVDLMPGIIGSVCVLVGVGGMALALLQPRQGFQALAQESELLGMASCMVAVYSYCQWASRLCYLLVKRRATRLSATSRNILLFFRRYHGILGWLVLATAAGHAVVLLPRYSRYSLPALLSGAAALLLLGVLVGLGLWIEQSIKQKRLSPKTRAFHVIAAATFFLLLLLHLTLK